jgi:hypothetical protein
MESTRFLVELGLAVWAGTAKTKFHISITGLIDPMRFQLAPEAFTSGLAM